MVSGLLLVAAMRLLFVFLLVACGQPAVDLPLGTSGSALIVSCPAQPPAGEPLTAQNPAVSGDTLTFTVSHSGGCKQHTYGVCWDGTLLESAPPQARLKILHEDQGDRCEAVVTRDLQIDLTSLKARLQSDFQMQSGTVILRLSSSQPNPRYDF